MKALSPKKGSRIVVAMSGGVDSCVAAAWLKQQGHEVIGISLQLHDMALEKDDKFGSCCSLTDIGDARRVAEKLDIPFYVTDMEEEFDSAVVDDFVQEYMNGRTPNPCVRCNEKVKFHRLMDWAMDLGADYLATGHYAGVRYNAEQEQYELFKGADASKDQSYFLFTLKQEDLKRTLFPLGGFQKDQVRNLAERLELGRVAKKPDSQEICFVQTRNYSDFIESRVAPSLLKPGNIVSVEGKTLGTHKGLHGFTIGQRKGLGVNSSEPLYVLELRKETNEVVVGEEKYLFRKEATASHVSWIIPPDLAKENDFAAKIRYRATESPVEVFPMVDGRVRVLFKEPQRAITPGQAIVFYRGDAVVGGGWIETLAISQ